MENNYLQRQEKEWKYIVKQFGRIQSLLLPRKNFHELQSYISVVSNFDQIIFIFVETYLSLLGHQDHKQIIDFFHCITQDLLARLKTVTNSGQNNKHHKQIKENLCHQCQKKINDAKITDIKSSLFKSSIAAQLLQIEQEANKATSTVDEDRLFFKAFYETLSKREQVLAYCEREEQLALKRLEECYENNASLFEKKLLPDINQNITLGSDIRSALQKSLKEQFGSKVPKWIRKMYEQFYLLMQRRRRENEKHVLTQTEPNLRENYNQRERENQMNRRSKAKSKKQKEEVNLNWQTISCQVVTIQYQKQIACLKNIFEEKLKTLNEKYRTALEREQKPSVTTSKPESKAATSRSKNMYASEKTQEEGLVAVEGGTEQNQNNQDLQKQTEDKNGSVNNSSQDKGQIQSSHSKSEIFATNPQLVSIRNPDKSLINNKQFEPSKRLARATDLSSTKFYERDSRVNKERNSQKFPRDKRIENKINGNMPSNDKLKGKKQSLLPSINEKNNLSLHKTSNEVGGNNSINELRKQVREVKNMLDEKVGLELAKMTQRGSQDENKSGDEGYSSVPKHSYETCHQNTGNHKNSFFQNSNMKKTNMTLNKLRIYLSNRKVNLTETDDSRIFSHSFDLKDYLSKYSSENTFKQNMSMQMYEQLKQKHELRDQVTFMSFSNALQAILTKQAKNQRMKSVNSDNTAGLPHLSMSKYSNDNVLIQNSSRPIRTLQQVFKASFYTYQPADLNLFGDLNNAEKYQRSFVHRERKMFHHLITNSQHELSLLIYQSLLAIQKLHKFTYEAICHFIRYPKTRIMPNCFAVNVSTGFSQKGLVDSFRKIFCLHRRCSGQVCEHVKAFEARVRKILDLIQFQNSLLEQQNKGQNGNQIPRLPLSVDLANLQLTTEGS